MRIDDHPIISNITRKLSNILNLKVIVNLEDSDSKLLVSDILLTPLPHPKINGK